MALRYWVGGTAAWDGTAGTKWALTSGGAGGQAIPTSADDVFFDASSGANTVTISTGNTGAKSITCTGFTGTLAGTAAISVAGGITLVAGQTVTYTGIVTITATGTLTTGGKTLANVTVNAAANTITLGSALTLTGTLTITAGTFTTSASNYAVTARAFASSNSNTRAVTLNASTITLSSTASAWNCSGAGITFTPGTSSIVLSGTGPVFTGGAFTYYNVSFTSTTPATITINNNNTFNQLTFTAPASAGITQISFGGNQTITTLVAAGASAVRRLSFISSTIKSSQTLTVTTYITKSDIDFMDINAAGTSAPWSGTRIGDAGGNTNITGAAAKTVYWNLAGTVTWSATGWATTSGGTPAVNNFPLAQDTIIFDNAGSAGTVQFDNSWFIGNLNMSARTSAMTLSILSDAYFCGDITLGIGLTINGIFTAYLVSRDVNQTITSNGISFPVTFFIYSNAVLGDAFTNTSVSTTILQDGTFNAVSYNVTAIAFTVRNITTSLGSGTWTLTGSGSCWTADTGVTLNAETSTIVLSDTSTTDRTFAGGDYTYNNLVIGGSTGTSTLTITGTNTFASVSSTKTVAHTIIFPNVTTTIGAFTVQGTSGNVVTLSRTGASGTFTLTKSGGGVVSSDYLSISNSAATPATTWYAGANSTNGGNNTGWIFTVAPLSAGGGFLMMFI